MIANTDKDKPIARLLVVDDDSDNVEVLKLGLQKNGFLVDAFTNPQEALQKSKLNAESYRLVLSDIWMPPLTGLQLAKNVKDTNPNVKVLLLTGSETSDVEYSKSYPSYRAVDGVAQKPIRIRKLTDKILNLIGETKGRSSVKE